MIDKSIMDRLTLALIGYIEQHLNWMISLNQTQVLSGQAGHLSHELGGYYGDGRYSVSNCTFSTLSQTADANRKTSLFSPPLADTCNVSLVPSPWWKQTNYTAFIGFFQSHIENSAFRSKMLIPQKFFKAFWEALSHIAEITCTAPAFA